MIWTDTPCRITCWNHGNWIIEAHRHESIEFIVAQHPWLENDCLYADIILPANTTMEVDDCVTNVRQGPPFQTCTLQDKAIEPVGESKSDYEIVLAVAEKLGLEEKVTEGKSVEGPPEGGLRGHVRLQVHDLGGVRGEEVRRVSHGGGLGEVTRPACASSTTTPKAIPLKTPSGLLEFYSERLATHFPDDEERPPIPKWIEKGVTHDERISSERADLFPLLLMSNHPRWRTHAQGDDITWARETPTGKVLGSDGYQYEPVWMHPADAAARGIKHGDIVKIFNERGIVLGGACVWERIMPGVAYIDHGARPTPSSRARSTAAAPSTPSPRTASPPRHCCGQATSGYLVDVQKVRPEEMGDVAAGLPRGLRARVRPGAGLRFNGWVVEGGSR